jgi:hypothetical protein
MDSNCEAPEWFMPKKERGLDSQACVNAQRHAIQFLTTQAHLRLNPK